MKKIFKIFTAFFTLVLLVQNVYAAATNEYIPQKLPVKLAQDLCSNNIPSSFKVIVDKGYKLNKNIYLEVGSVLTLQLVKVNEEKVGKIDANVVARVKKIYIPSLNKTIKVKNPDAIVKLSAYKETDYTDKGIDAGIYAANHFVKHIILPAQFVRGAIENDTGDRLSSGAQKVYQKSPLSLTEKGQPVQIKAGNLATMSFVVKSLD